MEGLPEEAWIILRVWDEPECWVGGFPSNLYQQMVVNDDGKTPRHFDSYFEADKYCHLNALIDPVIIPIAGAQAMKLKRENRQLNIPDVSGRLCDKCGKRTLTMVFQSDGEICFDCYNKIEHNYL